MLTSEKIISDGKTLVTKDLQALLDKAYKEKEELFITKGIYLTSSLFLHSDMKITFEEGAVLLATTKEEEYPILETRVAGIDMPWYVGILNIEGCSNVIIKGHGVIDGSGVYWWDKYWGADFKSGMRKIYDEKGLRWACDYDCKRPRNIIVSNSDHIVIEDLESRNSGFWNFHILYSFAVLLKNVIVNIERDNAPSTDGIDIDSSYDVTIDGAKTTCNDDSICVKSGRDYDGYRKNISCHDITIKNSTIHSGYGITIGSEVSGGVYNVDISNIRYEGTDCGFRIKSSQNRRGYIKNIHFHDICMTNVKYLFHICLDWNRGYSICKMPEGYEGKIEPYYETLCRVLDESIQKTKVSDIFIENVKASNTQDYDGISRAFTLIGYKDVPISGITIKNSKLDVKEYGILEYAEEVKLVNTDLKYQVEHIQEYDDFDNR